MKPVKELVVKTGVYTNRAGDEKARWTRIGTLFKSDKGLSMKLDSIPVSADWDGWVSLFDPKPRDVQAPPAEEFEDSLPF